MIELENHSAFPAMVYEKLGYKNQIFDVLAIKGSFRLKTDGTRADLAQEQQPLVMVDTYWGDDPLTSSLRHETDLVLGKKRTDVHVIGNAYSTGAKELTWWDTSVQVGPVSRALRVHGPRHWFYSRLFWRLGDSALATQVPLRYELAYGGQYQSTGKNPHPVYFDANPVGVGFYDITQLDKSKEYPAAQLTALSRPLLNNIDAAQEVLGYGPISRWWTPRKELAGTYDQHWQEKVWPYYPADFNPDFFNSAPPELRAEGFLEGNEPVVLKGLLPEAETVETALGAYIPLCVVEDGQAELHKLLPRLETVTIDTDARQIYHTWRLTLPRSMGIRHIVLGALTPPPHAQHLKRTHPVQAPIQIVKHSPEQQMWQDISGWLGKGL